VSQGGVLIWHAAAGVTPARAGRIEGVFVFVASVSTARKIFAMALKKWDGGEKSAQQNAPFSPQPTGRFDDFVIGAVRA